MKKLLIAYLAGSFFITTASYAATAQYGKMFIASSGKPTQVYPIRYENVGTLINALGETVVNTKALANFNSEYAGTKDAQWSATSNGGFVCRFTFKNLLNRAFYSKNGNWEVTMTEYTEENLPRDIRSQIKSTYYDYTIQFVQELNFVKDLKKIYLIQIQDSNTILFLRIDDDGLEVVKEINKL